MSRNHYKGIPKTRSVYVDSKDVLRPLSPRNPLGGDSLVANSAADYGGDVEPWARDVELFVRNSGHDSNDGLTEATAVLTLERLQELLPEKDLGKTRYLINLTGYTAVRTQVTGAPVDSGKLVWRPHEGFDGFNQDATVHPSGRRSFYRLPLMVFADPILVQTITTTGSSQDPVTGVITLTVSETLVPDAHKGQFILDTAAFTTGATIVGNTANAITIAFNSTPATYESCNGIFTQSCVLDYGDENIWYQEPSIAMTLGCRAVFSGIKFKHKSTSTVSSSIQLRTKHETVFIFCDFQGIVMRDNGTPSIQFSYCSFTENFYLESSGVTVQGCFFDGVTLGGHGDGGSGKVEYQSGTVFDGCSPIGGGNHEQDISLEINNCWIKNSTSIGILHDSPTRGHIAHTLIESCGGDAIHASVGAAYVRVRNVHGTDNGGYGLYLGNGQQAKLESTGGTYPSVSGTLGEIRLGSKDVTWASGIPQTDADNVDTDLIEFCRIF